VPVATGRSAVGAAAQQPNFVDAYTRGGLADGSSRAVLRIVAVLAIPAAMLFVTTGNHVQGL
jgi:hypothetical protein